MGTARRTMLGLALMSWLAVPALAADKAAIDAEVQATLADLRSTVAGSGEVLDRGKGVLVIPNVTKAGFVVGGFYGEGALLVDGKTDGYYSVAGGAVGLLAGVESSSQVLVFLTEDALKKFQTADGWEAGATANVTVIQTGAAGSVDTTATNQPIVAFVFGQSGLMAGVGIDGAKYSRIER